MRTTLTIDDVVIEKLIQDTGQKQAVVAIRFALDAYLKQRQKQKVLSLRGQVQIEDNWQALRALEQYES